MNKFNIDELVYETYCTGQPKYSLLWWDDNYIECTIRIPFQLRLAFETVPTDDEIANKLKEWQVRHVNP